MNPYTSYGRSRDDEEEQPKLNTYGSKTEGKVKRRNPYTSYGEESGDEAEKREAKKLEDDAKKLETENKKNSRGIGSKLWDAVNLLDGGRSYNNTTVSEENKKKKGITQLNELAADNFDATAKFANTAAEGVRKTVELGRGITGELTGDDKARDAAIKRGLDEGYIEEGAGVWGKGGIDEADDTDLSAKDFTKSVVSNAGGVFAEVGPIKGGAALRTGSKGARVVKGAGAGVVEGGVGTAIESATDKEADFDLAAVGQGALAGAVLGGVTGPLGKRQLSAKEKADLKKSKIDAELKSTVDSANALGDELDQTDLAQAQFADSQTKGIDPATGKEVDLVPETMRLGDGRETAAKRIQEIEDTFERINRGGAENGYDPTLAGSVDEAGMVRPITMDAEAKAKLDETRMKMDEETTAIDAEIDALEAKRSESVYDGETASEAQKNAEIKFKQRMQELRDIPENELPSNLKIVNERQILKDYQAELLDATQKYANREPLTKSFDDARAEMEARKVEMTDRYEMELADIETRSAVLDAQRVKEALELTPAELKDMMREKKALQAQNDAIEYAEINNNPTDTTAVKEAVKTNPAVAQAVETNLQASAYNFQKANPDFNVGIVQGTAGTQENVMNDAGIGETWGRVLDGQHKKDYAFGKDMEELARLAKGINGDPKRATKIFEALQSKDLSKLDPPEKEAAEWFKRNFKKRADEMGLPEEERISGYVTHLFKDKGSSRLLEAQRKLAEGNLKPWQVRKYNRIIFTADPELARLQRKNTSGKVNNKFLEKRTGAEGYETDPFNAYRVYMDKAYTKIHMEEPMKELAASKAVVSESMAKYINRALNKIKKVPDEQNEIQEMINNSIDKFANSLEKMTFGKVNMDSASLERGTKAIAKQIYRGTLQFNPGTAITNFSQTANTFGELGRWTAVGMSEATGHLKRGDLDELHQMGVLEGTLSDALINDETLLRGTVGKLAKASDNAGWFMFQKVEEVNRATAYYGAKRRALAKGMDEKAARAEGARIARKTQFKFGTADTPLALQGTIAKNFTQLLTFSVKQAEYLKRSTWNDFIVPAKNGEYRLAGEGAARLARLTMAYTAMGATVGQVTGVGAMDFGELAEGDFGSMKNTLTDNIPFYQYAAEGNLPASPLVTLLMGSDKGIGVANLISGKNQYGSDTSRLELGAELTTEKLPRLLVPGGAQMGKTADGLETSAQGYSETDKGRVRFGLEGIDKYRAPVFGQYNTEGGREYIDAKFPTMTEKESAMYKIQSPARRTMYEDFFKADDDAPSRDSVSTEVSKLAKEGSINKAQRRAAEYNASVDAMYGPIFEDYKGMVPKQLKEYVESKKISALRSDVESRSK